MTLPPKLQPGDTVGIIAPSGSFERERLAPGLAYLRGRGFRVREGESLYARDRYLAGTDRARADDVHAMFADAEVKGIFVARGGYGAARILDLLDWGLITRNPKALVGLSDTTALQLGICCRADLIAFSGLSLCSDVTADGLHPETESALWDAVCSHRFAPVNLTPLREGEAAGTLIGGCLSLVVSLAGTAFFPPCEGAVIALEDVNEPPYRVDRMLNQLAMAGAFDRAAGVVFGEFVGCEPERDSEGQLEDVIRDFTTRVPCPVYCGLPYGHGKARRVLPIGLDVRIDQGVLAFGTI